MNKKPPNAAVIELARIFLEFEVQQIEERRTAAAGLPAKTEPAATATNQVTEATRQVNHTPRRRAGQMVEVAR
ncbi:MAG: hypothetical protein KJ077_12375 [Anaerolineae bacterium]|nr:hypothetical protein [Anaerolineae bacterium]